MPSGDIKKNYIYNLSFQIFSLIIPLVTAPYIARVLQPDGVGTYSYINSIATYFSLMAALGLSSYGLREVSRVRDDRRAASKLFWELTIIRYATTVLCLLLYLGFVIITGRDLRLYLCSGIIILSVGVDSSWFYQALEKFKTLMLRNFIVKIISVTCVFLFVKKPQNLALYMLIQGGGTLVSNVILQAQLYRWVKVIPWRKLAFRKHLKETLVYFVPTIATSVYTVLDRTMIGAITHNMAEDGFYEQAHKIVNMLMTLITSLNVVVGVRTSYLFGQNKKKEIRQHIYDTFRFIYMVAFPLAAGLAACAADFVPWFYGAGYEKVTPLLMMFSPLLFVIGTSNVLGSLYLTPSGQRARSNRAIIAGAVCNFLLNLLLIPFFRSYGAVIASVSAECVISLLYLRYSHRFISVPRILRLALRYAMLSAVMFIPTFVVGKMLSPGVKTSLLQIVTGVAAYTLCIILTRDPFWIACKDFLRKKLGKFR